MGRRLIRGSRFLETIGVTFELRDDGSVAADFTVGSGQEGPPGHAHGGVLAALIDEAMSAASWFAGNRTLSVHLGFDYKRPVPVGAAIHISGQVERRDGRKVFTSGAIRLADGTTAVEGSGIFVSAPQVLENMPGFSLLSVLDK